LRRVLAAIQGAQVEENTGWNAGSSRLRRILDGTSQRKALAGMQGATADGKN
jgi:hypothetical protein